VIVVIGHYPDYLDLGAALDAIVFDLPQDRFAAMDNEAIWLENRAFLDAAIKQSARIILATPPDLVRPGSFLARELAYLMERGYRVSGTATGWEVSA